MSNNQKSAAKPDNVIETKRKIVFVDGTHLNIHNVKSFNAQGSYLRILCDEGYVLINPKKVLYHICTVAGDVVS